MMAGITVKTGENKKRCDKEYLQWVRLFADFLGPSEKGSESIQETRGQWRVCAESARYGGIQGRNNHLPLQFQKTCA